MIKDFAQDIQKATAKMETICLKTVWKKKISFINKLYGTQKTFKSS